MKTLLTLVAFMVYALLLLSTTSCVFSNVANVAWNFDSSRGRLRVAKGFKIKFVWNEFHDLYLLKKPCRFDNNKVLLAPASQPGNFTWDTSKVFSGQYYFGCSIGNHCLQGVSMNITVCKGRCKNKRRRRKQHGNGGGY